MFLYVQIVNRFWVNAIFKADLHHPQELEESA